MSGGAKALSNAERQRDLKARRAAANITRCSIWAHKEDHAALKAYALELKKRRQDSIPWKALDAAKKQG